ncbi:MAG: hypothetical protein H6811_07870 [Phycisphaeraceae bacterium]|nr:hypothetical protein [Phycisphaeraceae bacterium]
MLVAISPYHLSTREPAAMAALLLASRCVTFLPSPADDPSREQFMDAARRGPEYREFLESWRWSMALWDEGLVSAEVGGMQPLDDIVAANARLGTDPLLAPLREMVESEVSRRGSNGLSALAGDIVRSGPDPMFSVPIAAGLDAFALRLDAIVARSDPTSLAQRAEMALASPLVALAVPVLIQASGDRLLAARDLLEEGLADLRSALAPGSEIDVARIREAARGYCDAFAREREDLLLSMADDEVRPVEAMVTLRLVSLPVDAVLRSSLAAAEAVRPSRSGGIGTGPGEMVVGGGAVRSLIVGVMGRSRR